jgi:hypothetical protein
MSSKRTTTDLRQLPEQGTAHGLRVPHPADLKTLAVGLAVGLTLLLTTNVAAARPSGAPENMSATGQQRTATSLLSVARIAPSPKCAGTPSGCH